jgi:hypothetical protein
MKRPYLRRRQLEQQRTIERKAPPENVVNFERSKAKIEAKKRKRGRPRKVKE